MQSDVLGKRNKEMSCLLTCLFTRIHADQYWPLTPLIILLNQISHTVHPRCGSLLFKTHQLLYSRAVASCRVSCVLPQTLSWWVTRSCSGLEPATASSWSLPPADTAKQPLLSVSESMMMMMRGPQSRLLYAKHLQILARAQTECPRFLPPSLTGDDRALEELSLFPSENMHKSTRSLSAAQSTVDHRQCICTAALQQ